METERNKAVARATAERLFNQGDLSAVDELIAPDAVDHREPPGTDCREHFRQVALMLRSAFPDLRMTIEDMIAEDDSVAMRIRMTGTHQGTFMGIPPAGRPFDVEQMRIVRFRDGQMTDTWSVFDFLGWREQLTGLPAARPVAAD